MLKRYYVIIRSAHYLEHWTMQILLSGYSHGRCSCFIEIG